jgi:hypothetical protein
MQKIDASLDLKQKGENRSSLRAGYSSPWFIQSMNESDSVNGRDCKLPLRKDNAIG